MTDQMTEQPIVTEPKPDTFHDQAKIIRVANLAGGISWFFLFLFVIVGLIIGYLIYLVGSKQIGFEQFVLNLPTFFVPFLLSGFFWVVTKLLSESVYLVMDIEDNSRRP
jgi:hypothetical protein